MSEFTYHQLMRTGHVSRWQIVRTARTQTLAEHLYRVWVITGFLCSAMDVPERLGRVASTWALMHDTPEVITGDIATPTKVAIRNAVPEGDPVRNIELTLSETYEGVWLSSKANFGDKYPTASEIVKVADLMEAKNFLGCEMIGEHARTVYDGICTGLSARVDVLKIKYPDLDWANIQRVIDNSWIKV